MGELKTHYAVRLLRSIRHMGETVWQPLCYMSNTSNIKMSTELHEVTCENCQNKLVKERHRLGISRQVNQILRHGVWYKG